jgi:hypothetical protein
MKRIILFVIITILFLSPCLAQNKEQQQNDDPPTPIQLGVLTEKQKKHSKLYNRSPEVPTLISEDRDVLRGIGESFITEDFPYSLPISDYFKNPVCQAETIIVGRVIDKSSQLSEDLKSIFTDYEVKVQTLSKTTLF